MLQSGIRHVVRICALALIKVNENRRFQTRRLRPQEKVPYNLQKDRGMRGSSGLRSRFFGMSRKGSP